MKQPVKPIMPHRIFDYKKLLDADTIIPADLYRYVKDFSKEFNVSEDTVRLSVRAKWDCEPCLMLSAPEPKHHYTQKLEQYKEELSQYKKEQAEYIKHLAEKSKIKKEAEKQRKIEELKKELAKLKGEQ